MSINYYEPLLQEDINWGMNPATKKNPGGGELIGTQVGLHSLAIGQTPVTQIWDPPTISALGVTTVDVPYPGSTPGFYAVVTFTGEVNGSSIAGLFLQGICSQDLVTVALFNPSPLPVNVTQGTLFVLVVPIIGVL